MKKIAICPTCKSEIRASKIYLLSSLTPIAGLSSDIFCPNEGCRQIITVEKSGKIFLTSLQIATIGIGIIIPWSILDYKEPTFLSISVFFALLIVSLFLSYRLVLISLPYFLKYR